MVFVPDNPLISIVGTLIIWGLVALWFFAREKSETDNAKEEKDERGN